MIIRHSLFCFAVVSLFSTVARAQIPAVPEGHPRVYVRAADLPGIKAKLETPEFAALWDDVRNSKTPVCKAFVYLVNGDEAAGRQAVTDILAQLNTSDDARRFDVPMHNGAIIYDWCYALLSETEKNEFIAEFERIAGLHSPGYPAEMVSDAVVGHVTEGWLMTGQLPAGVAVYDESKTMYDAAAALFFDKFVGVRDFLYFAHMHHQGDSYGAGRFVFDQAASWLFCKMGAGDVLSTQQQFVPYQFIYNLRPDGQQMRSGDTYDEVGKGKRFMMMLTGAYYEDPFLLTQARFDYFYESSDLDKVMELVLMPAGADRRPISELPAAKFFPPPMGELVARTGWKLGIDSDDAVIRMRIGGTFFGNHQHNDFGIFQIYYRGSLAISSGVYEGENSGYDSEHWKNYYHQTIAHNGLLIFDPAEEIKYHNNPTANDGGQRWPKDVGYNPKDLEDLLSDDFHVADVTAHQTGPDDSLPDYAYISGDITRAYSQDKATLVTRSMVTLNTFDSEFPASLVVFDRLASKDAALKKTWLLHSIQEPSVDDRTVTIINDGASWNDEGDYGGKLELRSLLPASATISTVGGPGREFWIESTLTNYATTKDGAAEPGAWRVEISPQNPNLSDSFLNVMTVMDATTSSRPPVTLADGETHVGAAILDRAVLFGKEATLYDNARFTLTGAGDKKILVCDLEAGSWKVEKDDHVIEYGVVSKDGTCLYFKGDAGDYALEPGSSPDAGLPDNQDATPNDDASKNQDGTNSDTSGCGCNAIGRRPQTKLSGILSLSLF